MKYVLIGSLFAAVALNAADSIDNWFQEGSVRGNIRYYYISTSKEGGNVATSSQHSNAIGGQLGYVTGSLYGLKLGATFMTTQPFALPEGASNVEQSTLARDNAKRPGGTLDDGNQGFSVLGEAYAQYDRDTYQLWYGRKVINTPLMDAKDVRMMPSSFEGAMGSIKLSSGVEVGGGFIDKFKQRTSDRFEDVITHALGSNTQTITGHNGGYVVPVLVKYVQGDITAQAYDYYAPDFMNSIYADVTYKGKIDSTLSYTAAVQGIAQDGIGNADSAAAQAIMGGKINAQAVAAKGTLSYADTTLLIALSHVFSNDGDHDSLVLPWDGTPLYTDMLTANDLFMSDYGKGLESDSAQIGGATGLRIGVTQKLDFTGLKGAYTGLSYAHYDGGRFSLGAQEDLNGEVGYGIGNFSCAVKGIWVKNNTSLGNNPHAAASVIADFTQYRVIANYKF